MSTALIGAEAIGRSISLPAEMAEKLDSIAATRHVSGEPCNHRSSIGRDHGYEQRRTLFLDLGDRFRKSTDPAETERLRIELANMTFGH